MKYFLVKFIVDNFHAPQYDTPRLLLVIFNLRVGRFFNKRVLILRIHFDQMKLILTSPYSSK